MLDGRLHGKPEFEGVACFDKAENCLPEFSVDEWAGLVFVNLDNACAPLTETLVTQATSVPVMGTIFDVVSVLAVKADASVKLKGAGTTSHPPRTLVQAHVVPLQNSTQPPL